MAIRKMSRRQLASAMAAAAALPSAQAPAAEELLKQAREQVLRNAEQLTKREVPMATEPAFHFKA